MNIYKNKRVFISGISGFKGSWLSMMLLKMGAIIKGYSLEPEYEVNHFDLCNLNDYIENEINDIRDYNKLEKSIQEFRPDIIFHLAAQPLVRRGYRKPYETFQTNMLGTLNLLEICRNSNLTRVLINVTTDKVYKVYPIHLPYNEHDKLGGDDPYSASKACSELITHAYSESFFNKEDILVATVRAGNCIAGGDFSENRLLPDIMRAIRDNSILILRNPDQTRPFQHVLDTLYGYLMLGEKLLKRNMNFVGAWNFAPNFAVSVEGIIKKLQKFCTIRYDIQKDNNVKETQTLELSAHKAKNLLNWKSQYNINESLFLTYKWYEQFNEGNIITEEQVERYLNNLDFKDF